MSIVKGGFQRLFQTFLYFLLFLCAGIILGIYSYFLAVLADRNEKIPTYAKAVEGISGAAVLYLIFAVVLTCCLGGITVLALLAIVLDVAFAAGMIVIAVLARNGADSCKGMVKTPIGNGPASFNPSSDFGTGKGENVTAAVHYGLACRLNTAAFAVAIIAAFLFLCTAAMQLALIRHHKKEKRFGPSPSNNYTSGSGGRFGGMFGKKNKNKDSNLNGQTYNKDAEAGHAGSTGLVTEQPNQTATYNSHGGAAHSGYYTAPTGTAASNPYGYTNTNTMTTTSTNY